MAERSKIEGNIRDWLADHLDFIAPGLKLIEKEYYLPDEIGARGFVDLLCEDEYHNFVVIELKRSDTSARQTISEVLKYYSLIKHNFSAKESEIRTIVISTHWNELIRPFSETVHRTTLDLTGYEITLDEDNLPGSITKVLPLDAQLLSRRFAYWYDLYLFQRANVRQAFLEEFEKYLLEKGFTDFVLVQATGDLSNRRVINPCGVIVAFQKMPLTQVMESIRRLDEEEFQYMQKADEFDDEVSYRNYLEGEMINALDDLGYDYESEACYPQKVNQMRQAENWQIEKIKRFGIFSKDPRYSDELLINELCGLDGNSENEFFGFSESTQAERMKEIRQECRYALQHSPVWLETIDAIFEELSISGRRYRIMLHIFNPDSLMVAIYHSLANRELGYLPSYFLSVDYLDDSLSEIYYGGINWNLNAPRSTVLRCAEDDYSSLFFDMMIDPDNVKDAKDMSLEYTTAKHSMVGKETKFQGFVEAKHGRLVNQYEFLYPFAQFAVTYQAKLANYLNNFERSYVSMNR